MNAQWPAVGFGIVGAVLAAAATGYQLIRSRGKTTHGDLERLNEVARRVAALALVASAFSLAGLILPVESHAECSVASGSARRVGCVQASLLVAVVAGTPKVHRRSVPGRKEE